MTSYKNWIEYTRVGGEPSLKDVHERVDFNNRKEYVGDDYEGKRNFYWKFLHSQGYKVTRDGVPVDMRNNDYTLNFKIKDATSSSQDFINDLKKYGYIVEENIPDPPPPPNPQKHWLQYHDIFYNQHIVYQYDTFEISGENILLKAPFIKWVDGRKTHEQTEQLGTILKLPKQIMNSSSDESNIAEKLKTYENPQAFNMYLKKINDMCSDYVKTYELESLLDCLVITKRMRWGEMLGFDCLAFRGTPDTSITYDSRNITENITEFYCGSFTVTNVNGLFSHDYTDLSSRTNPTSKFYDRVSDGVNSNKQSPDGSWYCWQGKFELIDGFVGRRKLDKPLDRLITIFEYYIPSLAYEPAIEPNRCGDLQDTEIALLKCPELSPACNDTYMFAGPVIQYQYYMQKKQPLKYDNYSYVRRDNAVNIEEHVDNIRGYNYCVYKNKGKYFYAFIMKKEYVNERTTRLYLATDVIQTFLFDFELEDSMVDRCHVDRWERGTTSTPTNEIEDEGLEFGDNKIWQGESEARYRVAEFQDTYIAVTSDPLGVIPSRKPKIAPEEGGGGGS